MKPINKIPLRKLALNGNIYLWKRGHYHLEEFDLSKCAEQVIIFLEGYKNSPLKLHFREEDNILLNSVTKNGKWQVGYPNAGVIWYSPAGETAIEGENTDSVQINLNRPAVIIKLIDYFLANGWEPKTAKITFLVDDALTLLDETGLNRSSTAIVNINPIIV